MRLLITSGRGPAECRVAVDVVKAEIIAAARAAGIDWNAISGPEHSQGHGPASVVLILEGEAAQAVAAPFLGSIQYVWSSTIRPGHKRKNWFVSVSLLSDPAEVRQLDPSEVTFETMRAGGPGGQHQNTTDSAVRAVHRSGLTVVVREGRSQHQNKKIALERLGLIMQTMAQVDAAELRDEAQSRHDALQRGNPVRVIKA